MKIVVFGAGGHANVVLATIEAQQIEVVGLLDDDESIRGRTVYDYQILGGREQLARLRDEGVRHAIVAIGDNFRRVEIATFLLENGFCLATLAHPTSTRLRGSSVGAGSIVLPNALVGAGAIIADNAIISTGSVIGHGCVVGTGAHIAANATLGGDVRVGDYSLVGLGATILPRVTIGRRVIVGANAAVTNDLADGVTAVGVPAKIVQQGTIH